MKNKIIYPLLFLGLLMVCIAIFTQPSILNLNEGKFISSSSDKNTYEPNDQIRVTWTYKNTWSDTHRFLIEGELNGGQDTEKIKTIMSEATTTDSFTFTAPSTAGTYNIKLEGSVEMVEGRWTSGDGSATVTIVVEEPIPDPTPEPEDPTPTPEPEDPTPTPEPDNNEDVVTEESSETTSNPVLTVNSNVEGVNVAYEFESKTIDDTLTTAFEEIPKGQTFQFIATKDGYQTKIFNIYLESNDIIVTLDINPVIQEDELLQIDSSELNEVTVIVLNDANIPINECRVFIGSEGKQTNPDGQATFNLADGTYLVSLTHENYLSFTQEYPINQDTKMTITLGDKSDFTGIPSINVNMESVKDYQVYLLIGGILLVILAGGLLIYNKKKGDK